MAIACDIQITVSPQRVAGCVGGGCKPREWKDVNVVEGLDLEALDGKRDRRCGVGKDDVKSQQSVSRTPGVFAQDT
jgi:hypothetical protein